MQLLVDKTGENFLTLLRVEGDNVLVQFISEHGVKKGKPFNDSLRGLFMVGWHYRETSTAIGLERFKQGILEDQQVSYALHQLYPLGRKIKLPDGNVVRVASYANTHRDGYYMFVKDNEDIKRLKITPQWQLLPTEELLRLPYFPAPKTEAELKLIDDFDTWAGGF